MTASAAGIHDGTVNPVRTVFLAVSLVVAAAAASCVDLPENARFKCATRDDCLKGEVCAADLHCAPGPAAPDASGPARDAAVGPGLDASSGLPDAEEPAGRDASTGAKRDAAAPAGPDAAFTPGSCQDVADPKNPVDGYETIFTSGDAGVLVYCLQTLEGGGWTLVARSSAAGTSTSAGFGWLHATGDAKDLAAAYSLGALARGMSPSELLVVSAADAGENAGRSLLAIGPERYRIALPAAWTQVDLGVAVDPVNVSSDEVGCREATDLQMLRYVGCTTFPDYFFLRDNPTCENFGLGSGGFGLSENPDPCYGGNLNGKQGMIFAR